MILNFDCFRDTLFCVAKLQIPNESTLDIINVNVHTLYSHEDLSKYSQSDIYTALYYLAETKYITVPVRKLKHKIIFGDITGITMSGQEFLHLTEEPSSWEKIKNGAKSAGVGILKYIADTTQQCVVATVAASVTGSYAPQSNK